jgi:hypothetical protein
MWWGTAPLVVGLIGLFLLAVGAKAMPTEDDLNQQANLAADQIERDLLLAKTPETKMIALGELANLLAERKQPLPDWMRDPSEESPAALASRVRPLLLQLLGDHRDPTTVVVLRIAFYAGLAAVLIMFVLLFRLTPETNRAGWGEE